MSERETGLPPDIDPECLRLSAAINSIPGIETTCSCCGHGKEPYRIWFHVEDMAHLPVLLYFTDPCHVGFKWDVRVYTDCAMSPPSFFLESRTTGSQAYRESNRIAKEIERFMATQFASRAAEIEAERNRKPGKKRRAKGTA